jgi:predicted SprT family Zn-dependent metalloprotease
MKPNVVVKAKAPVQIGDNMYHCQICGHYYPEKRMDPDDKRVCMKCMTKLIQPN